MPSKINALLINFAVVVDTTRVYDIISAAGFDMGEEGQIEVPEDDRIASIANGRRKIPEFTLKYRLLATSMDTKGTHKFFTDWWKTREQNNKTITVVWLRRDRSKEIFRWVYQDCEFVGFKGEDQEYASPKVGIMECKFLPYDVDHSIASSGKVFAAKS